MVSEKPSAAPALTGSNDDKTRLLADYDELIDEISTWHFQVGPLGITKSFGSMRLARYFIGFHLVVGLAGIALILAAGAPRELGMAMVVGALFGFGAFLAQVWTVQVEKEQTLGLDVIKRRHEDLHQRLRAFDGTAE